MFDLILEYLSLAYSFGLMAISVMEIWRSIHTLTTYCLRHSLISSPRGRSGRFDIV